MIKALFISMLLAVNPSSTRTEIGFVRNAETIETADGNLWCGDVDPTIATKAVVVTFDTKGTDKIEDDEILEINPIY